MKDDEQRRDAKLNQEISNALQVEIESEDANFDEDLEIEYKLYRLEKLVERRPLLLK